MKYLKRYPANQLIRNQQKIVSDYYNVLADSSKAHTLLIALFTPPRKRPRNAGNKAADVVDLTSNSPKRAKPAHDTSNAAINSSWSPKPSLARKIDDNSSEVNNVPNLLQKAVQEKSELDRMDVRYVLSVSQSFESSYWLF
jgi:hypothetical protein